MHFPWGISSVDFIANRFAKYIRWAEACKFNCYWFTENVKIHVTLTTTVDTRDGKDYLNLDEIVVKMEPAKYFHLNLFKIQISTKIQFRVKINFENLFNQKDLSDNMNAVLNENADLVYKELQIPIEKVVGDALKKIFTPVCKVVSYNDLFLKE